MPIWSDGIRLLKEPTNCRSNYWLQTIILDESNEEQRNDILAALNNAGLMSRPCGQGFTNLSTLVMLREWTSVLPPGKQNYQHSEQFVFNIRMKIGYFGDGPWSHRSFEKLIQKKDLSISFVCARFDKKDHVLRRYADTYGIPFFTHRNINNNDFLEKDEVRVCDLFVSMSFNQIFKKHTFQKPRLGTINCHAGKLPSYRGRNILNWVLINDENEFGITVHYVDEGIDTGDIIKQSTHRITDADDYSTLLEKAYSGCSDLLSKTIDDFLIGKFDRIPQSSINNFGLYCSARQQATKF